MARRGLAGGVAAAFAVAQLAGCYLGSAQSVRIERVERERGWVVARGVPLIHQRSQRDCAAAALTMLLARWEGPARIEDVRHELEQIDPRGTSEGHSAGALREVA